MHIKTNQQKHLGQHREQINVQGYGLLYTPFEVG